MRINGTEIESADGYAPDEIKPGRYFLALYSHHDHGGRIETYRVSIRPFRTNRSHEVKLQGWCGETNNVNCDACGAVEIYRDKAGRLRVRRADAMALLDEISPDSDNI